MRWKRRRAAAACCSAACPACRPAEVVVIGGGVSGTHAATIALGMGANVTLVDKSNDALRRLAAQFGTGVRTIYSTRAAIAELVTRADLRDRRGAGARRGGAQADHPRDAVDDEAGLGDRRHCDRPGRLLRDLEADDPLPPDLCRRRRRPLLRRQHARRGRAHLDLRAQQRDAAFRAGARRQGLEAGAEGRLRTCATASMSTTASSPASRSPRRMACPTRRPTACCARERIAFRSKRLPGGVFPGLAQTLPPCHARESGHPEVTGEGLRRLSGSPLSRG